MFLVFAICQTLYWILSLYIYRGKKTINKLNYIIFYIYCICI